MSQPLVSVVIPVYNAEVYLDKCVRSVVEQTYSNLEIILVDDGSPDHCPEMCDRWAKKDKRILVIHQKNTGQGIARNAGIEAASGKYIFFFDSDDYVELTIVEKCVVCAEQDRSDAVLFGRWDVWADGHRKALPLRVTKRFYQGTEVMEDLLPKLFTYALGLGVGACGRMYRLQVLKKNSIRFLSERKMTSEDACFALMFFAHAQSVSIVPENLYCYLKNSGSFSRVYLSDRQEKNNAFLNTCMMYVAQEKMPEAIGSHLKARYHMYTISAMKQILQTELPSSQKKTALWEIFRDPVLHSSLSLDVLQLEKASQRVFFTLLKYRCYYLCYWLLAAKLRKA